MTSLETRERNPERKAVGVSAAVCAGTLLVAVLLHVGVQIPLGFTVLDEPERPFAVIVEGLAGAVLAVGAYAFFARKAWAWAGVTWAHGLALAGVLWRMVAVAAGRGAHTHLNTQAPLRRRHAPRESSFPNATLVRPPVCSTTLGSAIVERCAALPAGDPDAIS